MLHVGAGRRCIVPYNPNRAVLDLNFATMSSLPGSITFSRASSATDGLYTDAAARAFNTFSSGVPVLNSNGTGIAIWQSATNFLLNSNTPATQTTGSLGTGTYVLFGNGTGTLTSAAGTATGSGFGTISTLQGNFQTITITVAGTVTITKAGTVNWFDLQSQGFPTSHIVTAGATATRAADVASLVTSAFPWNPSSGATVSEYIPVNTTSVGSARVLGTNSSSNAVAIMYGMTSASFYDNASVNISAGAGSLGVLTKAASSWGPTGTAVVFNGSANASGGIANAANMAAIATIYLFQSGQGSQYTNGWFRRLRIYGHFLSVLSLQGLTR